MVREWQGCPAGGCGLPGYGDRAEVGGDVQVAVVALQRSDAAHGLQTRRVPRRRPQVAAAVRRAGPRPAGSAMQGKFRPHKTQGMQGHSTTHFGSSIEN